MWWGTFVLSPGSGGFQIILWFFGGWEREREREMMHTYFLSVLRSKMLSWKFCWKELHKKTAIINGFISSPLKDFTFHKTSAGFISGLLWLFTLCENGNKIIILLIVPSPPDIFLCHPFVILRHLYMVKPFDGEF